MHEVQKTAISLDQIEGNNSLGKEQPDMVQKVNIKIGELNYAMDYAICL